MELFFFNYQEYNNKKEEISTDYQIFGLILSILSLVFDSICANYQKLFKQNIKIKSIEFMELTNFWGLFLIILISLFFNDFFLSVKLFINNYEFKIFIIIRNFFKLIGGIFVFYNLNRYGPNNVAMIISLRKIFSVFISYLFFNHSINITRIICILVIIGCLYFEYKIQTNKINKRND